MTAKWLSEPDNPTELAWFFDAPWEVASDRRSHKYLVRSAAGSATQRAYYAATALGTVAGDALRQVIYGNPNANPAEMTGLAAYFNTRDPNDAANAVNVLDAGGVGEVCSAWLVGWGPRTVFMVSPDGEPFTINSECCVAVADWRYVVRIANIDAASPDFDVFSWLARAMVQFPSIERTEWLRPIFYVNHDVVMRMKDRVGKDVPVGADLRKFRTLPIRVINELRSDEARV